MRTVTAIPVHPEPERRPTARARRKASAGLFKHSCQASAARGRGWDGGFNARSARVESGGPAAEATVGERELAASQLQTEERARVGVDRWSTPR
eukprot:COSAG02_NODE_398_length_23118_cov_49.968939_12_plen_94_part_00